MAEIKEDINHIPDLKEELEKLNNTAVAVGVPGDKNRQVIIRAGVHEYGSSSHKEVGFIRRAFDNNKDAIAGMYRHGVEEILEGEAEAIEIHERVGEFLVDEITENIESEGLVDTGEMRDSIAYEVVEL